MAFIAFGDAEHPPTTRELRASKENRLARMDGWHQNLHGRERVSWAWPHGWTVRREMTGREVGDGRAKWCGRGARLLQASEHGRRDVLSGQASPESRASATELREWRSPLGDLSCLR